MTMSNPIKIAAVALALGGTFTGAAQAQDGHQRWFDVVNASRTTAIHSVYATHRDHATFGRDLLGRHMIAPGGRMRVQPSFHRGYCIFDVRVRYESGRQVTRWGVNLCSITALVVSPNGSIAVR
ncbi:hypothetical protein [Phreatobacter sp.]|uniref:hypothetical protein n=1 Tax=Phreatobacter sp. TaxID=1966341 RepID=UPI003F725CBA